MSDVAARGAIRSERSGVTIEVDRELCFGAGDCVDSAPDVFQLDAEGKSVVVDPDGADLDGLLVAAGNCPVNAITVTADGGEQIYP